jgi:hypothetical protein
MLALLSRKIRVPVPVFVRVPLMDSVLFAPEAEMTVGVEEVMLELQLVSVGEILSPSVKPVELLSTVTFAPLAGTPLGDQLAAVFQVKLLLPVHVDCANEESWAARNRSAGRNARSWREIIYREGIDFIALGCLEVV